MDQGWATDIIYIPLQKDFLDLVAFVDLVSRNVLVWKLSNSLGTKLRLEALGVAMGGGHSSEVFHYNHSCHFTASNYLARLQAEEIKISWSGRNLCPDNIFIEGMWRMVKHENTFLRS